MSSCAYFIKSTASSNAPKLAASIVSSLADMSKCSTRPISAISRFQATGMIEGFGGFEIFDFGIVLGGKILASIFLGSLISAGILWVFRTI